MNNNTVELLNALASAGNQKKSKRYVIYKHHFTRTIDLYWQGYY